MPSEMLCLLGASTLSSNPATPPSQESGNELVLPNVLLSRAQLNRQQADQARRLVQERLTERRDSPPTHARSEVKLYGQTIRHDWKDDRKTLKTLEVPPASLSIEQQSAKELLLGKMRELYPLQLDRELREQASQSLLPLEGAGEKSASLLDRSESPPDLIPEWNVVPEEPPPDLLPEWNVVAPDDGAGEADAVGHSVHTGTHTPAEQRAETRRRQTATAAEEKAASKARIAEERETNKARAASEKARVAGEVAAEKDRLAKEKQGAKAQEMKEKGRVAAEMRRKKAQEKSAAAANARLEAMATAKAVAAEKVRVKAREKEAHVVAATAARARAKAERQGLKIPDDETKLVNMDSASEAWPHDADADEDEGAEEDKGASP